MKNKFNNWLIKTKKVFLLVIVFLVSVNISSGQETTSISKWRLGTSLSGGYTFAQNNFNDYVNCNWELDLYHGKLQTSFYSQAGWNEIDNMFDFGLRAGYNVVDGKLLQVTPVVGFGFMNFSHHLDLRNIPTPSVGANFDFKIWTNKRTKRNDVWKIRLQYNCSLPLTNERFVGIHSIAIGIAID